MNYSQETEENEYGLVYDLRSLYYYLQRIPDTRGKHGKQYPLTLLLIWMILAKMAGEDKPSGIAEWVTEKKELWVEYQLTNKEQTASHMTYRRVLQEIISVEEFEGLLDRYHQDQHNQGQEILLSMDGKSVRGTIEPGETRGTHLLAIYAPQKGLVLAQASVDRKENEIVVAPQLLRQVSLAGAIVVADAMHTQKATCSQIVESGGQYVMTVKDNQARTRWAIEKLFVHEVCNLQKGIPLSRDFQIAQKVRNGHGRIEKRVIMTSTLLNDYLDWPGIAQVFRIEKTVTYTRNSCSIKTIRYGITSLSPDQADPLRVLALIQDYWGIESGLHYRRDVSMHEDATRLTIGDSGQNMAILNNLVLGLCLSFRKNLPSARRVFNAHPYKALNLIISPCQAFL
jgi:predicted transposase YbfD/YdcC